MIAVFVAAFVAVIAYSSVEATRTRYRVCVEFHGRVHCAEAQGRTAQDAIRSAHDIDCGLLAGSRDELMACESTEPQSVESLAK